MSLRPNIPISTSDLHKKRLGLRSGRFGFGLSQTDTEPIASVSVSVFTEISVSVFIDYRYRYLKYRNRNRNTDRRRMQRSSLEPSRRAASNGGSYILLRPLDAEIFNETSTIRQLTFTLLRHLPFR